MAVRLSIQTTRTIQIRSTIEAVFSVLKDVPVSGKMFPGIATILDEGDGHYSWQLDPRTTLGHTFIGKYRTLHENNGKDVVKWKSIEGNLQTNGVWTIRGRDHAVTLEVQSASKVDVPVPSILRKPAQLFAQNELSRGTKKQLEAIKSYVEP